MVDFISFIKGLLSGGKDEKNQPFLHEVICRNDGEQQNLEEWLQSYRKVKILNDLQQAFKERDALGNTTHPLIAIITSPSASGFIFYFDDEDYNSDDFRNLFDYLKDRVVSLDYKEYVSDAQTFIREEGVEVKERHYLKPRGKFDKNSRFNQRYGNITIEHLLKDKQPQQIKFLVSPYTDHKYTTALAFFELVKEVLEEEV